MLRLAKRLHMSGHSLRVTIIAAVLIGGSFAAGRLLTASRSSC